MWQKIEISKGSQMVVCIKCLPCRVTPLFACLATQALYILTI